MNTRSLQAWQRLRQHRSGWYAMLIFMGIVAICMAASLIANDKPLLVKYQQSYYLPIWQEYSEQTFGGVFETEANYRDPAVQQLINEKGWVIWPLIPYSENTVNYEVTGSLPAAPSLQNWLGTDDQGRDVLTRILYALRHALLFSFAVTLVSAIVGISMGAIQGYFGGWVDLIGQRILEVWSGLPMLFMLMILVSVFTPNIYWLFAIMCFFAWTSLVDIVRAELLRARQLDYVMAARSIGASHTRIIFRHILPNVMQSSLSQLPFMLTANITALTALDFLGYGLPADYASIGELLLQAKNHLDAPWLGISAFLSLAIVLALLIYIGEALRDTLNPQQRLF